jgi:hypothetical protein
MPRREAIVFALSTAVLLGGSRAALAQATTGTVTSGGTLNGAVQGESASYLLHSLTGAADVAGTGTTNINGVLVIPGVPAGTYSLQITFPHCTFTAQSSLVVIAGQTTSDQTSWEVCAPILEVGAAVPPGTNLDGEVAVASVMCPSFASQSFIIPEVSGRFFDIAPVASCTASVDVTPRDRPITCHGDFTGFTLVRGQLTVVAVPITCQAVPVPATGAGALGALAVALVILGGAAVRRASRST